MSELSLIERVALAAEDGEHYEVHLTEVGEVLEALRIVRGLKKRLADKKESLRITTEAYEVMMGRKADVAVRSYLVLISGLQDEIRSLEVLLDWSWEVNNG